MNLFRPRFRRWSLPILSVVLLCAAIIFSFDPGHMDADALGMLAFIHAGTYRDWYPLLLPLLLKISVALRVGPVAILAFQVLLVGLSTFAILAFFSNPLIAAAGSYCVLLCPAVLGYLGAITSHAILTAFLLCGVAALLYLDPSRRSRGRLALLSISFSALSAASIARITGVALTLPLFCIWVYLLSKELRLVHPNRGTRLSGIVITGCTLTAIAVLCGNTVLSALFHPIHTGPIQGIALYDISAISLRANRLFLDREHFPDQSLDDLRRIFVKNNPDVLFFLGDPRTRVRIIFSGDQTAVLRTWRGCIAMYPGYYVTERWQMLKSLLGLDFRVPPLVPYHPGIDRNDQGYHIEHQTEDAIVVKYLRAFQNTVVDRPFIYLIVLLLAVTSILLLRWESGYSGVVLLALATGNFVFVAGHFIATPSGLLRYLWPSIVTSMVISAAVAVRYLSILLSRHPRFEPTEASITEACDASSR